MSQFDEDAQAAGFTDEQIKFMQEWLSLAGHRHDIEDVEGLEEALEVEEEDEDED